MKYLTVRWSDDITFLVDTCALSTESVGNGKKKSLKFCKKNRSDDTGQHSLALPLPFNPTLLLLSPESLSNVSIAPKIKLIERRMTVHASEGSLKRYRKGEIEYCDVINKRTCVHLGTLHYSTSKIYKHLLQYNNERIHNDNRIIKKYTMILFF